MMDSESSLSVRFDNRRAWLQAIGAMALGLLVLMPRAASAADEKPLRVCLVSGSLEYESNESLAGFQKYLEDKYHVKCSRAFVEGKDETRLPGLENLDDCDVVLLFTRRLKLSGDDLERIKKYCLSGKPLVGVRTASHAIQSWLDLDKEVLGGNYKGHFDDKFKTQVNIKPEAKSSPLLVGVEPFVTDGSLYKNQGINPDCQVLMTGTSPESTEPVTWTRMHNGGRVFYTSLGHQHDFEIENFRRLLVNALYWAADQTPRPR